MYFIYLIIIIIITKQIDNKWLNKKFKVHIHLHILNKYPVKKNLLHSSKFPWYDDKNYFKQSCKSLIFFIIYTKLRSKHSNLEKLYHFFGGVFKNFAVH